MQKKNSFDPGIGLRIREARRAAGITQEKLAESIHVSPQYMSSLERGLVGARNETIVEICRALQVSADYILLGEQQLDEQDEFIRTIQTLSMEQISLLKDFTRTMLRMYRLAAESQEKEGLYEKTETFSASSSMAAESAAPFYHEKSTGHTPDAGS